MKSYIVAIVSAALTASLFLSQSHDQELLRHLGYSGIFFRCLEGMWFPAVVFTFLMRWISSKINIGSFLRWVSMSYVVLFLTIFSMSFMVLGGFVGPSLLFLFYGVSIFFTCGGGLTWALPMTIGGAMYLVKKYSPD